MCSNTPDVPIVIPAYQSGQVLLNTVESLVRLSDAPIIIVNDGSRPDTVPVFDAIANLPRVHVLHHAVNLGEGAALKTDLNHALVMFPSCTGVVSADADGQHNPEDICAVREKLCANPDVLVLGVRMFDSGVPWRSRVGNQATRVLMNFIVGQKLSDTQTGLRGIPP